MKLKLSGMELELPTGATVIVCRMIDEWTEDDTIAYGTRSQDEFNSLPQTEN